MSELDILTQYLKDHNIPFERYDCDKDIELDDEYTFHVNRHQICVPNQRYALCRHTGRAAAACTA